MALDADRFLYDGFTTLDGGVDSGRAASLLPANKASWAKNCSFRNGFITQRPGFRKRTLKFLDVDGVEDATVKANFEDGRFQGAGYYRLHNRGYVMVMVDGRLFRIDPVDHYKVTDVSGGETNPDNRWRVWMQQAEDWLIVQDGQSAALIYNGGSCRRAASNEVPTGTAMAYGMGRLVVARGRQYFAGDLVYSDSGTELLGYRDAVLKFTEDTYYSEGGSFVLPLQSGEITGMHFVANIDTSLGQGELVVFSREAAFTNQLPLDRTTWKQTPGLQRIAQINGGSMGDGIVAVNGDLFYRSEDGIRSMIMATRDFSQWGNRPISQEVSRAIGNDARYLLQHQSATLFDNRLLMTAAPVVTSQGVYHRGLIALDFNLVSNMFGAVPPAYDNVWTGVNTLKLVTGQFGEEDRCFVVHLNTTDDVIELWELTRGELFDDDGSTEVSWEFETQSYNFKKPFNKKRLWGGDLWYDQLNEEVGFTVSFRPDQYPGWLSWHSWTDCQSVKQCDPVTACYTLLNTHPGYRSRKSLPQPPRTCNELDDSPVDLGYEFQMKVQVSGPVRFQRVRLIAEETDEQLFKGCAAGSSCATFTYCDSEDF
mgnify:CR=1 FL=1